MALRNGVSRVQPAEIDVVGAAETADSFDGPRRAESYLCSLAYVEPSFAEYVVDEFVDDSLHALQPPFGVDAVALARHARASSRLDARVRAALAVTLAGVLSCAGLHVWLTFGPGADGSAPPRIADEARVGLPLLAISWVLSWVIVAGGRMRRYARVRTLLRSASPGRDLAPAVPAEAEKQLIEAMTGNVVVFQGGEPLGGHGEVIGKWSIDVDLTKAAIGENGRRRDIVALSASEVHGAVAAALHTSGIPNLRVDHCLFVRGTAAPAIPGLLPDRFHRPVASLPGEMIVRGAERPSPNARTYLRTQKVSWSGDLVLNVLVRAEVVGGANLYVEFYACGILPLRLFARSPEWLPKTRPEIFFRVLRECGLFGPLGELFAVPGHAARRFGEKAARRSRRARDRRAIRRGYAFDYGPAGYVREDSAEIEHYERFAKSDEDMYIKIMARRTMNAVRDLLVEHGVDTSEFDLLEKQVNNTVYNIGNISGSGNAVGDHNTIGGGGRPSGNSAGTQRK